MRVYRYLNEQYGLEALQEREIKVGRLLELNDPADCRPVLVGAPKQKSEKEDEAFAADYLAGLYQDIGVVCYSAVISDPVIWSHYADSHRGIALGFDFDPVSGSPLYKVAYQDDRPQIDYQIAQDLRPGGQMTPDFIQKVIINGFTCKASSWCYEKEYRRFVSLGSHPIRMKGANYFEKDFSCADEVVLGLRCRLTESDIIRAAVQKGGQFERCRVRRAQLDRTTYTLKF
jgi:Protein of unknown function (DUF2971)